MCVAQLAGGQPHSMQRFEVMARVSEGAYGTVWACRDRERPDRIVAVKKLKEPQQANYGNFCVTQLCSEAPAGSKRWPKTV